MRELILKDRLGMPIATDPSAVATTLARVRAAARKHDEKCKDEGVPQPNGSIEAMIDRHAGLLAAIAAGSPFLHNLLGAEPDLLAALDDRNFDEAGEALLDELAECDTVDRARLMAQLRRSRRRVALVVALADLTGTWPLERVTATMTRLADIAVSRTLTHILRQGVKAGEIEIDDPERPERGSGLFIIAMGKHGAGELNYSSDIDLITFFDVQRLRYRGAESAMAFAIRSTRTLTYMLETETRDGYVFRTDFRLRPHLPGHPLALPTDEAELYYERHGQNWERAAFIKARAIAGDLEAGNAFLAMLRPFIWRKHLDYAAIRDIHSIKRQINAYRGFSKIAIHGHDLKVGRGGIREIEFFAQTQQLILGGRHPEMRSARTLDALHSLAQGRWIENRTAADLDQAYRFLRAVEHRLQMVADRQTQILPKSETDFARFCAFAGFADEAALREALLAALTTVEKYYAALFEAEPDLGFGGNLVFTGTDDDPGTIEHLAALGFARPKAVSARFRAWHHGHIRATRSTAARELLTELTPAIFEALSRQKDLNEAFALFDEFISGLPAGVQIFSLLRANARLLLLLCDITGAAPRLARFLAGNVDLFDSMMQPDFFESLPSRERLRHEIEGRLRDGRDLQDLLDLCRNWAHGRQFQAGLHVLLGASSAADAACTLSDIAEIVLEILLPEAERWLEEDHGRIAGGRFVVLALGKLGSRELSTGSDLDLVFVYDAPPQAMSNGPRPLDAPTWFARLGQRLVSAITARTPQGRLYEIDTRLRPSGKLGPVACSFENFERYQKDTAQTWEQQALTRARVVAGDPALARKVEAAIDAVVASERDRKALAADVAAMRERIFKEHGSEDPWQLKHARGGIVELEFLAQFVELGWAAEHPGLRAREPRRVIEAAAEAGIVDPLAGAELVRASLIFQALQAVLRLSEDETFSPSDATAGVTEAILRAVGMALEGEPPPADLQALEKSLIDCQTLVHQTFTAIVSEAR